MIYKDLVSNITLLLSLGMAYSLIHKQWGHHKNISKYLLGFSFGCAAIIGMITPLTFMPGVVFDGRSILVSLAGLFGGAIAGLIAAALSSLYRFYLGGIGTWTGIGVILSSAIIGIYFKSRCAGKNNKIKPLSLLLLGVVVHIVMLLWMLTLPEDIRWLVLQKMTLPVLLGYPLATVLLGMFLASLDEKLRLDAKVYQSERLLNEIQALTNSGGWEYNVATDEMYWSDQVYRIHGIKPDPSIDHVAISLACYPPEDSKKIKEAFQQALADGQAYDLEARFLPSPGVEMWIRTTGRPIVRNGTVEKIIGDIIDITQWKKNEAEIYQLNYALEDRVKLRTAQLEASNQELEAFSFTLSHNLRAPLRALHGFSELLKKNIGATLDAKNRHYIEEISCSALQMGDLLDDLLSFFKIGRAQKKKVLVDMDTIVRESMAILQSQIQDLKIEWVINRLPEVWGDQSLLRLVVVNLLENALKFIKLKSQVRIEVACTIVEDMYEFYVRDNGCGFDIKYREKIFDLFERLHSQKDFEGTGVGLAIVRRIIESHGGRTWADSSIGQGATIYFSLPVKLVADEEAQESDK